MTPALFPTQAFSGHTLSDFDFDLPESAIALRPASPRHSARQLVIKPHETGPDRFHHQTVMDLIQALDTGDVIVFNDTRVLPARLAGLRHRDGVTAKVEATLHKRTSDGSWDAFMKPGKRLKVGDRVVFSDELEAEITAKAPEDGIISLRFNAEGAELDARVARAGVMPLPPYIAAKRKEDAQDLEDYQTVFSRALGSVAAPTAGLHFTPELLDALKAKGIEFAFVTLHVGAGTFLPVKTEDLSKHRMHAEYGEVSQAVCDQINAAKARGNRVLCVGTTALRLVESAATAENHIAPFAAETDIFITPGYGFKVADLLMTNFHLPKSTLMMLVSAFAGFDLMREAYALAISEGYRFYSYGDSSLLYRA